jgi:Putative beta-barrel porin 2
LFPACLVVLLFASATTVAAQDISQDPSESAKYHLGAIRFTPYIVIRDLGVDTNVYNENDADNPKQDTTATLGPGVNYWFKLGRARIAATSDLTYTWFRTYDDQRSLNTDNKAMLSVPLNRLTPFVDGHYNNGRQRVSYEIDARSYSTDTAYGGGLDLRVTGKSTLRFEGHQGGVKFREDEFFAGTNLQQALNRDFTSAGFAWRETLTALTIFSVKTDYQQDRFTYSTFKDSNSLRIMPGFEFNPAALIGGLVYVGYQRFDTLDATVPDYSGLVADVAANYRLDTTKFNVVFKRDITYSYEAQQPYYVLTDIEFQVVQKITHEWDLLGTVGRQWLGYRQAEVSSTTPPDRLDRSYVVGGGLGYELSDDFRVGLNVNYYGRSSNTVTFNEYTGLRFGAAISYGLPTR